MIVAEANVHPARQQSAVASALAAFAAAAGEIPDSQWPADPPATPSASAPAPAPAGSKPEPARSGTAGRS